MNLVELKLDIYSNLLKYQRMHRLLNNPRVEGIVDCCTEIEKKEIYEKIKLLDKDGLEKFLRTKEEITLNELRLQASQLGIKNYTFLSKSSLLSEIEAKNERLMETNAGTDCSIRGVH